MKEEYSRDFKGIWIPKAVWLDEDLTTLEKCLLAEIDSLDKGQGCYASNEYLASFFGLSQSRMANIITELRQRGYLKTVRFDGRVRFLRSSFFAENGLSLTKNGNEGYQKQQTSLTKNGKKVTSRENRIKPRQGAAGFFTSSADNAKHSPAGKLAIKYAEFLQAHKLSVEKYHRGRLITIRPNIQNWAAAAESLMDQGKSEGFISDVMDWYFDNYLDPYLKTYKSFVHFCQNFDVVKKAMMRQLKLKPDQMEEDYEGGYRGKIIDDPTP